VACISKALSEEWKNQIDAPTGRWVPEARAVSKIRVTMGQMEVHVQKVEEVCSVEEEEEGVSSQVVSSDDVFCVKHFLTIRSRRVATNGDRS
jgi:hypothetical protein